MLEESDLCVCVGGDIPHADGDMACNGSKVSRAYNKWNRHDCRLALEDVTLHMWGSITVQGEAHTAGR